MSRVSAALQALVVAIVFVAPSTGAQAQGVVNVQKLSAPLANEPGGQFDEECARAALAKIRDRMK
ncbi:MAG: hypothetical protein JWN13_2294 [Betaproteobacteria bacterium]|jgi:hypothetical protein|nr:hypothetical protein [Betaproteobacteria bacterium]